MNDKTQTVGKKKFWETWKKMVRQVETRNRPKRR